MIMHEWFRSCHQLLNISNLKKNIVNFVEEIASLDLLYLCNFYKRIVCQFLLAYKLYTHAVQLFTASECAKRKLLDHITVIPQNSWDIRMEWRHIWGWIKYSRFVRQNFIILFAPYWNKQTTKAKNYIGTCLSIPKTENK